MTATPTEVSDLRRARVSDRVRSFLDRGFALPGDLYTDEQLFSDEMTAIFHRQWLYAGHVSQLANPGDYLTIEVGAESAIVVRDADGAIHGLLNVCRHRGSRLVDQSCGSTHRFVCPYHQWAYRFDGSLAGAPRMPDGFDKTQFPLKRVHTAVWNGFIFVNFGQGQVEDLPALMEESAELMAPFDIAGAKIAHTEAYDVKANWKLVWENSQECYHCNANHPEFIRSFDMSSFMSNDGQISLLTFTGDRRMQCGVFPLRDDAQSLTMTGEPASDRRLGEFSTAREPYTAAAHLKPGFASVFSPDYGIVFTDIPVAVDRTEVRVQWLVHAEAEAGVDYDTDNLKRVWDQTNLQDWVLCEAVQRGVTSQSFEPGPLSLDETSVAGFYHCYAGMMADAGL